MFPVLSILIWLLTQDKLANEINLKIGRLLANAVIHKFGLVSQIWCLSWQRALLNLQVSRNIDCMPFLSVVSWEPFIAYWGGSVCGQENFPIFSSRPWRGEYFPCLAWVQNACISGKCICRPLIAQVPRLKQCIGLETSFFLCPSANFMEWYWGVGVPSPVCIPKRHFCRQGAVPAT